MSEAQTKGVAWWREALNFWPLGIALLATIGFGSFTWFLAHEITAQDNVSATRWDHFLQGRPNELGDTLSGFVGSLTLIWVVASVIQQSLELRAQRREFFEMVVAQDAQVKALEAQTIIFEDEKLYRQEARAERELDVLIGRLANLVKQDRRLPLTWSTIEIIDGLTQPEQMVMLGLRFEKNDEAETVVRKLSASIRFTATRLLTDFETKEFLQRPHFEEDLSVISTMIDAIMSLQGKLSLADRSRCAEFALQDFHDAVHRLIASDKIWDHT